MTFAFNGTADQLTELLALKTCNPRATWVSPGIVGIRCGFGLPQLRQSRLSGVSFRLTGLECRHLNRQTIAPNGYMQPKYIFNSIFDHNTESNRNKRLHAIVNISLISDLNIEINNWNQCPT